MVDAECPGPVMAVAGQMRRTYHPGPLTLGISLRPGRDNRSYIGLPGVGDNGSRKTIEKAARSVSKSTYILNMMILSVLNVISNLSDFALVAIPQREDGNCN
jgi:hypothetical protein